MWSSRLFWKLLLLSVGLNVGLAIAFFVLGEQSQRRTTYQEVGQRLHDTAMLAREQFADLMTKLDQDIEEPIDENPLFAEIQEKIERLGAETQCRFTIVRADGTPIADSALHPQTIRNLADRPELVQAAASGVGSDTRLSSTLQQEMRFYAVPLVSPKKKDPNGAELFIRSSASLAPVASRLEQFRRGFLVMTILLACVGTLITAGLASRIVHPISRLTSRVRSIAAGDEHEPLLVLSRDEIGELTATINRMQSEVSARFRELSDNNRHMATVLGSMGEGIIAVDASENIVLANDASKRLLNFSQHDGNSRPLVEAVRSRPLLELVRRCMEQDEDDGTSQVEFTSSGQPRRRLSVRASQLPGDPKPGVVIVLHDITELRRLENLRQEFVANVSHELKTPLASVKAFAETLRLGAVHDPENNVRFVQRIEEQAERLHQLIQDMLQIARIESGEQAFDITTVLVDHVVEICASQHGEAARRKDIQIVVQPPGSMLNVRADEEGLRTILDNLISNGIKYTPKGGSVRVSWRRDQGEVILEVADTGIGIAYEDQARIFERFFRVDKARSRELGGTGLGLSIVKHLSQAFGGSVELHSQVGKGSKFLVRLPVADRSPELLAPQMNASE